MTARKVLCTMAAGEHLALLDLALPGFEVFSERHGYDMIVEREPRASGRPVSWSKVAILMEALGQWDVCVWVDADALIMRSDTDVAGELDPEHSFYMVEHRGDGDRLPNAGVLMVQDDEFARWGLQQVWDQRRYVEHHYWESAAFMHLLGYRVPPSGASRSAERILRGALWRAGRLNPWPSKPVRWTAFAQRTRFLPLEWNALLKWHDADLLERAYIRHYAGIPLDARLAAMSRDAESLVTASAA